MLRGLLGGSGDVVGDSPDLVDGGEFTDVDERPEGSGEHLRRSRAWAVEVTHHGAPDFSSGCCALFDRLGALFLFLLHDLVDALEDAVVERVDGWVGRWVVEFAVDVLVGLDEVVRQVDGFGHDVWSDLS